MITRSTRASNRELPRLWPSPREGSRWPQGSGRLPLRLCRPGQRTRARRRVGPTEAEQKAMARIVELRRAGCSCREVAAALDAQGHEPRQSSDGLTFRLRRSKTDQEERKQGRPRRLVRPGAVPEGDPAEAGGREALRDRRGGRLLEGVRVGYPAWKVDAACSSTWRALGQLVGMTQPALYAR